MNTDDVVLALSILLTTALITAVLMFGTQFVFGVFG